MGPLRRHREKAPEYEVTRDRFRAIIWVDLHGRPADAIAHYLTDEILRIPTVAAAYVRVEARDGVDRR